MAGPRRGLDVTEAGRHALLTGIRDALLLPAWIVGFSLLGVGSLAHDAGHPVWAAMLSTVAIWAAPAQVLLYAALSNGSSVVVAAVAVAFSAIRLLPMTLAIMPYLRRPGQSLLAQLGLAHLVAATAWIEGMRRLPGMPAEERVPFFVGFAMSCLVVSTVMTGIGYSLVGTLPGIWAAAILCLTPIYFTVSMVGAARRPGEWLAIAAGLFLMPVADRIVGPDFAILAVGLVGGSAAYGLGRAFEQARGR